MFGGLGFRFFKDIPLNPPRPKSFFQFVTTLLRVRRRASMESGVQDDRSIGQEIAIAFFICLFNLWPGRF